MKLMFSTYARSVLNNNFFLNIKNYKKYIKWFRFSSNISDSMLLDLAVKKIEKY
jgi:hypothetical protein